MSDAIPAPHSEDPAVKTLVHDPEADIQEHAEHHAHSPEEEIAHAKEHARENIFWFIGFFSLILCAVATYEFIGTTNTWLILFWAAARSLLIAFFLNWLFRDFSTIFRTFLFTVVFFAGMVLLSMWGSTLPKIGDPIVVDTQH